MPSAAPAEPPATAADLWRAPSWKLRLTVLGLVVLGVAALFVTGGLDRVPPPPPAPLPVAAINENVDAGPWRAEITNAAATTDLGPYKPKTEGNWLLAIAVRIDVTTADSQPSYRFQHAVTLPGLAGLVDPEPMDLALVRDGSRLEFINPGLPERVAFIFEVARATPVPKEVTVILQGHTASLSWTTRRLTWSDIGERARVTVPIKDQTATP